MQGEGFPVAKRFEAGSAAAVAEDRASWRGSCGGRDLPVGHAQQYHADVRGNRLAPLEGADHAGPGRRSVRARRRRAQARRHDRAHAARADDGAGGKFGGWRVQFSHRDTG
jgi:hypothetical protein